LLRVALFVCVAAGVWFVYALASGVTDRPEIMDELDKAVAQQPDILYFGDSTLYTVFPADSNQQTMPEMLQEQLPQYTLHAVCDAAYKMSIYRLMLAYLEENHAVLPLLIVPVNPASFCLMWDLRPEWQFARLKMDFKYDSTLLRAFYQPLAVFKAVNLQPISYGDYHSAVYRTLAADPLYREAYAAMEDKELSPRELSMPEVLTIQYNATLTPAHRQVEAMMQLSAAAERMGSALLFYVTPIDYELGGQAVGERFARTVAKNIVVIHTLLEPQEVHFLDFSQLLPSKHFPHSRAGYNEHLDDKGREAVTEALAQYINENKLLP